MQPLDIGCRVNIERKKPRVYKSEISCSAPPDFAGCVVSFNPQTLELTVIYPDWRIYKLTIASLLAQLPKS